MDWTAFGLSLRLAAWTCALLIPAALLIGRLLAGWRGPLRGVVEALITLPLVLPPTVLGYYLLVGMGGASPFGRAWEALFGQGLVFHFGGLLAASLVVNIPFAVQPIQRAMEAVAPEVREAAFVSGMSRWTTFWKIDLPLAWPGVFSALALTFAHTLGEFGVVLMVGGNIPGETRTAAIAIYDRAQAFDQAAAGAMSAALLGFSLAAIGLSYALTGRVGRRHV
ncbi:molybdate ABC transporter permease subunit [Phenylobacterium aquaticum]|uniref:molybdate ABC transporter permease subunit n=1 Tax=Phenylobacterium aquaticum TaxID=1763816 RepID=UPI0026ECB8AA|nr:molybdate ABC transporter permease subunit [Phenylobacterium aquaticum]